jgi:cytochrome c
MQTGWIAGIGLAVAVLTSTAAPAQDLTGDREHGATVFKKCIACHRVGPEAKNAVGPILNGVVGRAAGTYPGYNYSAASKSSGLTWDEATLIAYLKAPKEVMPGTKMKFPGLASDQDAADVVAYLAQFDENGNQVETPPPQ